MCTTVFVCSFANRAKLFCFTFPKPTFASRTSEAYINRPCESLAWWIKLERAIHFAHLPYLLALHWANRFGIPAINLPSLLMRSPC